MIACFYLKALLCILFVRSAIIPNNSFMKKSYQLLCVLLALLVLSTNSFAQNNLAAGDLGF